MKKCQGGQYEDSRENEQIISSCLAHLWAVRKGGGAHVQIRKAVNEGHVTPSGLAVSCAPRANFAALSFFAGMQPNREVDITYPIHDGVASWRRSKSRMSKLHRVQGVPNATSWYIQSFGSISTTTGSGASFPTVGVHVNHWMQGIECHIDVEVIHD